MRLHFLLVLLLLTGILYAEEKPRIASLAPALTELIVQLGKKDALVGRTSACDYPEIVKRLPVVGAFGKPDMERLIALKPTHVFANAFADPSAADTLRRAGIRIVLKQCRTLDDYREWVVIAGKELHCMDAARQELSRINREVEELKKHPAGGISVLCLIWHAPPTAAGNNSLPDTLIRLAGLRNIAGTLKTEYPIPSPEWLLTHQPDVLLLPGFTDAQIAELKKEHPWKDLKSKIIADIDPNLLLRPGPRLTQGARILAERCGK